MCAEVLDSKEVTERWNLSDDDDYVDNNTVDDEEPENHLKEQVDELLKKIKSLLRGDSFSLELKEVPRYINSKQIEQFFEIDDPSRIDVEDPDPKNKRDVIVTFFNADDFCSALRKNGKLIGSYNYVASYNPNIHRKKKVSPRHRDGGHMDKKRSMRHDDRRDNRRDDRRDDRHEQSGDVRKQDKARENKHNFHRVRSDHGGNRKENRGAYKEADNRGPPRRKTEAPTLYHENNRYKYMMSDDED